MKRILLLKTKDGIENAIACARSRFLVRTETENNERLAIYGFLRVSPGLIETPALVYHTDKPDFLIKTPSVCIGLEASLITTPGLEHANKLRDRLPGGCTDTTDFLVTDAQMKRQEVLNKGAGDAAVPSYVSGQSFDEMWWRVVRSEIEDKVVKRRGYASDIARFGLLFLDNLSFDFAEMKVRVIKHEAQLRRLLCDYGLWLFFFRCENDGLIVSKG